MLLDFIFLIPLLKFSIWGITHYRLFLAYILVFSSLFSLFFSVYLVRRFGGTPGKLILGIRIRKLDGSPVGYREALLRHLPTFILSLLESIALVVPLFHLSDAEYLALGVERTTTLKGLAPVWYHPLVMISTAWVWSELIILLTNKERRSVHDFIAGTVVVHAPPKIKSPPVADVSASISP